MKKKAIKTPLALRMIQQLYPFAELVAPRLAHQWAFNMFFKPFRFQMPEREKSILHEATKFKLDVAERNIQCYSWGSGPVVLMVHGWAGRGTQFFKFVPAFVSNGYKVVAFDGPAHGASAGKSTNIIEFQEVLQSINDYYGKLEAVVTHSFGGAATIYALQQGLKVPKLVNIGSPTDGDRIIEEFAKRINGSQQLIESFNQGILRRFGRDFRSFSSKAIAPDLPDLRLLLIHDEHDKEVELDQAFALQALIPGAELMVTKSLGHTRILRDEQVIQKSLDFISQVGEKEIVVST